MLSIIDRYLFKEIILSWLAITFVLALVLTASTLAKVLGLAMDGDLPADIVFPFMLVKLIKLSAMLMPIGLYLGIMFALGRLYQDSEMSAMTSCGIGHASIFKPVLLSAGLGVLLVSYLVMVVSPWASREEQRIKMSVTNRPLLSLVSPGRFNQIGEDKTVIYAKSVDSEKGTLNQIFVKNKETDGFSVETAREASYRQVENINGDFIVFTDGERVTKNNTDLAMQITEFEKHGVLVERAVQAAVRMKSEGKSMAALIQSNNRKDLAEAHWRLAFPITVLLLALFAVPLSRTGPRQGRYGRIALAIIIYLPYSNLLVVGKKWISKGIIPEWLGLWWVHIFMLLVVLYLIARMNGPILHQWREVCRRREKLLTS